MKYYRGIFNRILRRLFNRYIGRVIRDKKMVKTLTPTFAMGCKRILLSDEYYKSMNDKKFKLEASGILHFTENGIQCQDGHHDLDIVIYATGFQVDSNYDWLTKESIDLWPSCKFVLEICFGNLF